MATRALPFAQRRGSTAFGRLTLGGAWAGLVLAVAGYWTVNPAVLAQTGANAAAVGPQAETAAGTVANANAGAVANAMAVDFGQDIIPLLSRHGCNAGGCHGKASGQNGFKLSLFGFDPQFDHEAIVRQARGRRLSLAAPGQSLLLTKATGQTPHGGGRRIEPGSAAYDQLYAWIAAGAPAANPAAPRLVGLRIEPRQATLSKGGTATLKVAAEYSDGRQRDVTAQAQFSSNLDVVAAVSEEGVVRAGDEKGEAVIMARFQGEVAVFRAILPHGPPRTTIPGFEASHYIDRLAAEKWKQLGLLPSPPADDATFLRRVTVDLCGRLPTVDEIREFLSDAAPAAKSDEKRRRVIDRLLDSPDYASYFALRWGAILRNSNLAGSDQAAYAFHNWLKEMLARNRPYDEMVRGIVAASGEWQDAPAINWYWQSRDDQLHQVTADTAQVFLGLRLQCARCHHHPYERWGQADYFGLAGFFTRLGRKGFGQPPPYYASATVTTGERNPLTGKAPEPKYLDGPEAKFGPDEDPRHGLVDWMAKPDNPFFARVFVNRVWGHFLGRGLVHEIDDMRETNPPSNPELLDALARDFVDRKFDMKHVVRVILNSRVYQLSSEPSPDNAHDKQNFARYYGRRLVAEVFLDAVDQATGAKTRFNGVSSQARAIDLPHEGFGSYFLDTFDRPRRVTSCECERSSGATLAQVLLLANSDEIENKLAAGDGRIARLIAAKKSDREIVDDIYLATLGRFPRADELATALPYVSESKDRAAALQDMLWTLLNTREFMFNH
ncbi:MAG: hypothetical protein RLY70_1310 [Planctomycetota bacterium]